MLDTHTGTSTFITLTHNTDQRPIFIALQHVRYMTTNREGDTFIHFDNGQFVVVDESPARIQEIAASL